MTGTLALGGLGSYSLLEAYRLLNSNSNSSTVQKTASTVDKVSKTAESLGGSSPMSSNSNVQKNVNEINRKLLKSVGGKGGSKLHAGVLVVFGLSCLGGAGIRWTN